METNNTNTNTKDITINELTPEMVVSVYSGKDGKCCCGCSGKHFRDARNIKRIVKILKENANNETFEVYIGPFDGNVHYFAVVLGERLYIAYLQ